MGHPTDFGIEEYILHECGWFRSWLLRRHFAHCEACRARLEATRRELELQREAGADALRYAAAAEEAEKPLKPPMPPRFPQHS